LRGNDARMSDGLHVSGSAVGAVGEFAKDFAAVTAEVGKVVVGHRAVVEGIVTALFCGGHVLLEGVPGLGKTLLIRTLSQAVSLSFSRIQFTPDLMPADITGTSVLSESERADGQRVRKFEFQRGPIFAQMVLADEINRATPKTQSALLEAMAERSVTVGGVTHPLQQPFFVMATQNPLEQEGTYPLPEAQLDRFFFKLIVGYSGRAELMEILNRTTTNQQAVVVSVMDSATLLRHQAIVRDVPIADPIADYAVRLVLATQPAGETGAMAAGGGRGVFSTPMVDKYIRVGASPRAAQAMVLAAKCRALVAGRTYVATEDLRSVALDALRHRLILNFDAQAEGVTTDSVVQNLIDTLPVSAA